MSRVYIAQMKCENNHCVLAAFGLYEDDDAAMALGHELEARYKALVAGHPQLATCFVCGATGAAAELGVTSFTTMEQAEPAMLALQDMQRQTAAFLGRLRKIRKAHEN